MSQEELRSLLERIFEDTFVEASERAELQAARAQLPADEVRSVFRDFFQAKWGEALQDHVVTNVERSLLHKIYVELGLDVSDLPPMARIALKDHV